MNKFARFAVNSLIVLAISIVGAALTTGPAGSTAQFISWVIYLALIQAPALYVTKYSPLECLAWFLRWRKRS